MVVELNSLVHPHLICSNALDGTEYKEILQSHYHAEKGIRKKGESCGFV